MINGYTLAIEGATYTGSVAVLSDGQVMAEHDLVETRIGRQGRPEGVLPAVEDCLRRAAIEIGDVAKIVCGAGPGSFTSLRIAASVAKGLSAGTGAQLYAVPSLALTVAAANGLSAGKYISVVDAMRDELYALDVELNLDGGMIYGETARRIPAAELDHLAHAAGARVIGPGREIEARPQARGALALLDSIIQRGPVDLQSWEPDYGRAAEAQVRWESKHGPLEIR
ncbi:MAG TPA: tRNA (adenosine(37)-N6)-threonylcarbamoyltransferase complex dimerization subunit type 1 TsaB [Gemmatimonadaceae bacterium]|jgi:tRNA threonylcarbamoyladenosine biosynthesis protein TsaB